MIEFVIYTNLILIVSVLLDFVHELMSLMHNTFHTIGRYFDNALVIAMTNKY